ncbi:galactose-3-O-sulfotransferase 2 [Siniperca chuatsi]|uniref:galactose-3-O-sulfotransferase 2 n=1 Tax=Siniperca chuatsi TaxID=119488 RepID=UPI001CE21F0A|nr:galactose-3-O-sulfotransferase 2 [Siniperca chuatsi]
MTVQQEESRELDIDTERERGGQTGLGSWTQTEREFIGGFGEMPSPPRRWIREQPLSSVTSCVRKGLCSKRHSLWILLILLVVCIAIQTFVARQARNDKLTGLPHLRFTVNKQHLFPTLQNVWEGLHSESSLAVKPDVKSIQTERTGDRHHQNEGYGKPPDYILYVDKIVNLATGSQMEARKVSPGKLLLPKHGNKLSLRLPGSLVLHSTRKGLTAGTDKRLISTPSPSSFLKGHINSVHTKATCHPKSHIVFLKTHKTASSTILNILYRYGESRNLTFALPLNRHSQLFYPFFFASHFVEGVSSRSVREFHIMCNHMRFKKSEVAKVMPKDTFYFSILRNPVAMMESIYMYYKSIPAFHKTHNLNEFLDNSWRNYNSSVSNNHYAHNILAFDFGFDNNVAADAEDLEDRANMAIAATERDFHLILISEYFDESMILLKYALCWSLEDVVSFRLNSRSEQTRHPLSPNTAEKIKRWNAFDWKIYLHFNTTFWHKVDSLVGQEQMKREVSQLRKLQAKLANTCLKDGVAVDPSQIKDAGLKPFQYGAAVIQGYNLNPHIDRQTRTKCQRLITPELQYTDRLYTQQFPELAAKHRQATRIAPQRQHSDRTSMMGMNHRQITRYKFSNLKNQKASRSALLTHTEANNKTNML